MRMYSLCPVEGISEKQFAQAIAYLIEEIGIKELEVICREVDYDEWPHDNFTVPCDNNLLLDAINFLSADLGFFTLSSRSKALIIPFEGLHFNFIVNDEVAFPAVEGLVVRDSTEVLSGYPDAYEAFGLQETFPPVEG